jgi:hypothetical protein
MFELNREFIINDNNGPLVSGKRFEYDGTAKVFKVGKMINIEASKVRSIHRAPYLPEISEKVELPLTVAGSNVINGTLVVTIAQEGRIISLVSDRLADHTKDYIFNGTPADWVNQFNRQAAMEDMDRLIDIEVVAGTPNKLVISAKDCYTRIVKVVYDAAAGTGIEPSRVWNRVTHFQPLIASTWTGVLTAGTEGMGTVTRILKNMRLQTNAHLHPHGFDKDERPLMHGEYEQWTIQYVSERRHQSGEVFGSINHSLVTLIFFVEKGVVTEWEEALFAGTGTPAGTAAAPAAGTLAKDANETVCDAVTATGTPARLVDKTVAADADKDGVYEQSEEVAIDAKKHKLSK